MKEKDRNAPGIEGEVCSQSTDRPKTQSLVFLWDKGRGKMQNERKLYFPNKMKTYPV